MKNYRIRGNEIIPTQIYKILSEEWNAYKIKMRENKNIKFSVNPDSLMKKLMKENPLIENYSILNPVNEAEELTKVNIKGIGGINIDEAITMDYRTFHKSTTGLFSMTTPEGNAGVVKHLTYDAKIVDNRGNLVIGEPENAKDSSILGIVELLSPFTNRHADPPRSQMQGKQTSHVMPTVKQDPALFGYGVDKTLPYILQCDDFVFKTKKDGVVKKIDMTKHFVILEYSDKTTDLIDLDVKTLKNSAQGFYTTNFLELLEGVKVGKKFKKGEILAIDQKFFKKTMDENISFMSGKLAKVAVSCGEFSLEDSCMIDSNLSKSLTSNVTLDETIVLAPSTVVRKMVKKGDKIKAGEPIIIFINQADDKYLNKMMEKISKDIGEIIEESGKTTITSKYHGRIVDVKIFYNVDFEDLSPSLKKIVKIYDGEVKERNSVITKFNKDSLSMSQSGKTEINKLYGKEFSGVLIEIFIEFEDRMYIGDKLIFSTALKCIVGSVSDEGESPYSDFDKTENINGVITPMSIIARMTQDLFFILYLNKILIELKKKIKEIME
jgi:hypothetical protein